MSVFCAPDDPELAIVRRDDSTQLIRTLGALLICVPPIKPLVIARNDSAYQRIAPRIIDTSADCTSLAKPTSEPVRSD